MPKYKGKTNEAFTMHLINQALCAAKLPEGRPVTLLDPMCGRGTTLFQAVNRGFLGQPRRGDSRRGNRGV